MTTILDALRNIVGEADFYHQMGTSTNYTWDYAAMIEYFFACLLLCIAVSSIFKLVVRIFG